MQFDEAFNILIGPEFEGDYSDHAGDPGGKTRYGITEATARRNGYTGRMNELPKALAKTIARKEYWDVVRADELPPVLRYPVFDAAYNSGPGMAARWLQKAVGAVVDGDIGPKTLAAVKAVDPDQVRTRMLGYRLRFCAGLGTWHDFGRGWARRIATILESS